MPTFRCPAQCKHCGTNSHPRELTWLSTDLIVETIDQAVLAGFSEVVFSGGEPTLAGASLLAAMRHARGHGLAVRLVTNAHWARTAATTARTLADLINCGLSHVTLSTGDEHARFVPLASVLSAARGCAERQLPATIVVEASEGRSIRARTVKSDIRYMDIGAEFPDAPLDVVEWIWSPLSPSRYARYATGETVNADNLDQRGGCNEIFSTTTLQADGTLSPCCGLGIRFTPELRLGNARDMTLQEADARARKDFLMRWISAEGPEQILAWAAQRDPTIIWENRYAHRCQACIRVFSDNKIRTLVEARQDEHATAIDFLETVLWPARSTKE